jgi:hypothetical protein
MKNETFGSTLHLITLLDAIYADCRISVQLVRTDESGTFIDLDIEDRPRGMGTSLTAANAREVALKLLEAADRLDEGWR